MMLSYLPGEGIDFENSLVGWQKVVKGGRDERELIFKACILIILFIDFVRDFGMWVGFKPNSNANTYGNTHANANHNVNYNANSDANVNPDANANHNTNAESVF